MCVAYNESVPVISSHYSHRPGVTDEAPGVPLVERSEIEHDDEGTPPPPPLPPPLAPEDIDF